MPREGKSHHARRAKSRESSRAEAAPPPPESVEEALARARRHGQAALAELVAALRALLDAATLAAGGAHAGSGRVAPLARSLEELRGWLDPGDGRDARAALGAVLSALDAEIVRWEERGRADADARAVLRAFLTVRELLWELGLRGPDGSSSAPRPGAGPTRGGTRTQGGRPRVQRVTVEG